MQNIRHFVQVALPRVFELQVTLWLAARGTVPTATAVVSCVCTTTHQLIELRLAIRHLVLVAVDQPRRSSRGVRTDASVTGLLLLTALH